MISLVLAFGSRVQERPLLAPSARIISEILCGDHKYMGVSTASKIVIHEMRDNLECIRSAEMDFGGHGICSSQWGGFLVPLGPGGVGVFYPNAVGTIERQLN
jgi:hypothetical protein